MSKIEVDEIVNQTGDNDSGIDLTTNDNIKFNIAGSQKAIIDSSGRLLVGKTAIGTANVGIEARSDGLLVATRDGDVCSILRRNTDDGEVLRFQKASTDVGRVFTRSSLVITLVLDPRSGGMGLSGTTGSVLPADENGAVVDNTKDIGKSNFRFDDIFATNSSIQTSDQNEKQDIENLTTKELNVAKKLSALFKTFKWKDKVAEKGDKARTHSGIIAQEVQSAFKAEGLDASNYGLFTSDTWWEKEIKVDAVKADEEKGIEAKDAYTYMDTKDEKTDGYTERTRLGVRYPELFSFIFSSIEARLTALESK